MFSGVLDPSGGHPSWRYGGVRQICSDQHGAVDTPCASVSYGARLKQVVSVPVLGKRRSSR